MQSYIKVGSAGIFSRNSDFYSMCWKFSCTFATKKVLKTKSTRCLTLVHASYTFGIPVCFLQKCLKPSWKVYILVGAGNTLPVSSMCRKHVSLKRFSYFLWNMYHKWVWRVWEQYVW